MHPFHIISMLILGLIAGGLARLLMPGKDPMPIWASILLGIAGSYVGGFVGNLIFHYGDKDTLHPGGIIMSIIGAMILLWLWRMIRSRS